VPGCHHVDVHLDDRRARWVLWAALAVVGAGLWAFVLRGADGPADPELGAAATTTTTLPAIGPSLPAVDAPGDPARVPFGGFGEVAITVDPGHGKDLLAWCLLLAHAAEERARGLMTVTDLEGYSGMAFVYDEPVDHSFYMRNTPMPLSIAWIRDDGTVLATTDMAPCEDREGCPVYSPGGLYRLAIEVPKGRLDDLGIVKGARVALSGLCAPRSAA